MGPNFSESAEVMFGKVWGDARSVYRLNLNISFVVYRPDSDLVGD